MRPSLSCRSASFAARAHASRVSFTHSRDIMVRLFFAPPLSGAFAL